MSIVAQRLDAYVLVPRRRGSALLCAASEVANRLRDADDDVRGVACRGDGFEAERAAFVGAAAASAAAGEVVRRAVECDEVEEGEEQHFDAEEQVREAEGDVVVREGRGRFQGVGGVQDGEDDVLQEGEEDDAFDAEELEDGFVGAEGGAEAGVDGEDVDEGDGDGDGADDFELEGKIGRLEGGFDEKERERDGGAGTNPDVRKVGFAG